MGKDNLIRITHEHVDYTSGKKESARVSQSKPVIFSFYDLGKYRRMRKEQREKQLNQRVNIFFNYVHVDEDENESPTINF